MKGTHRRCWREWRNNQHRTALRSHLLGLLGTEEWVREPFEQSKNSARACSLVGRLRIQTNHMLRCTICKSGTAMVEGEEARRSIRLQCRPAVRSKICRTACRG